MDQEVSSLEELLDRMGQADPDGSEVTLDALLDAVGRRSFGPLLLTAGLVTLAPLIGDIPGVPTIMGVLVVLIAGQMLFDREHFWLPRWMLERSVKRERLCKALEWLRRPARFVDRVLRPRLTMFVRTAGIHIIAGMCIAVAAVMPATEFVPFSANAAGAALTAFGLALIAHDGLLAVIALLITLGMFGVVGYNLIFS